MTVKTDAKRTGVRCFTRPDRASPFLVQWREDGRVKTESYKAEADRDKRATEVRREKENGAIVTASRSELQDFRAFLRACGETPWQDVVAGYRAWRQMAGLGEQCTTTIKDFAKTYLAALTGLSEGTMRQKKTKIRQIVESFGGRRLDKLSAAEIEAWIDASGWSTPATFNGVRKLYRAFFSEAVRARLIRDNPCDQVRPRNAGIHHVGILSVAQTARLFSVALTDKEFRDAIPRLALEAFAGLRFSSACRISKEDINYDDRGILLPAHKIKTKRRHYIDELPGNLWDWLAVKAPAAWTLSESGYMKLKSALFRKAEVPHPHNGLRHSFASYHVASFKDPGRTSIILCHTNQIRLWSNYKGNAKEADGGRYFQITPLTAAAMAEGWRGAELPAPAHG